MAFFKKKYNNFDSGNKMGGQGTRNRMGGVQTKNYNDFGNQNMNPNIMNNNPNMYQQREMGGGRVYNNFDQNPNMNNPNMGNMNMGNPNMQQMRQPVNYNDFSNQNPNVIGMNMNPNLMNQNMNQNINQNINPNVSHNVIPNPNMQKSNIQLNVQKPKKQTALTEEDKDNYGNEIYEYVSEIYPE
jgi:hypothetical protein